MLEIPHIDLFFLRWNALRCGARTSVAVIFLLVAGSILAGEPSAGEPSAGEPSAEEPSAEESAPPESQTASETPPEEEAGSEKPESDRREKVRDQEVASAGARFKNTKQFPGRDVTPEPPRWQGEPINLSLKNADLVEVLRSFAKLTEANLIIDPTVSGSVTVELKDVPWDQALDAILKVNGLGVEISGNVWTLGPQERLYRRDE